MLASLAFLSIASLSSVALAAPSGKGVGADNVLLLRDGLSRFDPVGGQDDATLHTARQLQYSKTGTPKGLTSSYRSLQTDDETSEIAMAARSADCVGCLCPRLLSVY